LLQLAPRRHFHSPTIFATTAVAGKPDLNRNSETLSLRAHATDLARAVDLKPGDFSGKSPALPMEQSS
jgi:hypothetical protein